MKSLTHFAAALLFLFAANNVMAACSFPSGVEACDYWFAGLCPNTEWCGYKDCLGRQFGDEVMFIAGGVYPKVWIAQTEGTFITNPPLPCGFTTNNGVSIIEMNDQPHCSVILQTDDHLYFELFASAQEQECVAWLECKCY